MSCPGRNRHWDWEHLMQVAEELVTPWTRHWECITSVGKYMLMLPLEILPLALHFHYIVEWSLNLFQTKLEMIVASQVIAHRKRGSNNYTCVICCRTTCNFIWNEMDLFNVSLLTSYGTYLSEKVKLKRILKDMRKERETKKDSNQTHHPKNSRCVLNIAG